MKIRPDMPSLYIWAGDVAELAECLPSNKPGLWYLPVTLTLRRKRQEDQFKIILRYIWEFKDNLECTRLELAVGRYQPLTYLGFRC